MTFGDCETQLKNKLQSLYDAGEATAIADRVLEEYTGLNRLMRRVNAGQLIPQENLLLLQATTDQLLQGKPLQYVLGYADFYGLRFQVDESVLIPRPETEELVEWIIKDTKNTDQPLQLLDIGTGSGCIAVTLKKFVPHLQVHAVDISVKALHLTMQNAADHLAEVHFRQINFLEENNWEQLGKYDIIVSNPPYIPLQEQITMNKNVTAWEPASALFVPDKKPLLFYEAIAAFGKTHLQTGGAIYMETHKDYAAKVQQLFIGQDYYTELRKDLHGNERMVKANRLYLP